MARSRWFTQKVVLKWENLAKPPTPCGMSMIGIILVAAGNKQPASICILEKYYINESTAGSAVIKKGELTTSVYNEIATAICHSIINDLYGYSNSTGK